MREIPVSCACVHLQICSHLQTLLLQCQIRFSAKNCVNKGTKNQCRGETKENKNEDRLKNQHV